APQRTYTAPRMVGLVEPCRLEAEREGMEPIAERRPCERRHGGRFEAARQEDPDRHVADQRRRHRALEMLAEHASGVLETERQRWGSEEGRRLPVAPHEHPLALAHQTSAP